MKFKDIFVNQNLMIAYFDAMNNKIKKHMLENWETEYGEGMYHIQESYVDTRRVQYMLYVDLPQSTPFSIFSSNLKEEEKESADGLHHDQQDKEQNSDRTFTRRNRNG